MATSLRRSTRALALPLLPALLLALAACDGGDPLRELNRGLPSVLTLTADTSAFDAAAPQAALPLEIRVTDPYGDAVNGVAVAWRPLSGDGASVEPDTTRTEGDGRTAALWELGQSAGVYRLSISSPASGATITVEARIR